MKRSTKWIALAGLIFSAGEALAQQPVTQTDFSLLEMRLTGSSSDIGLNTKYLIEDTEAADEEYPDPRSVLYRSMILPGWGQVTNEQAWKIPIIYALFAGVGYYNYNLTTQYRGYRAAFYNESRGAETDYRYGETPDFIPDGLTLQQLRQNRDNLRNQRDFSYIIMALAYGLNVLDAYVFAHMRSFDVSDDLSANATIGPGIITQGAPGIKVRVNLLSGNR